MENANLGDGSRDAAIVSSEHADTMFNQDQAETHMVKLVDGKLTPMGHTSDDVMDDQMQGFQTDEERALQTSPDQKIYERSDAALRVGTVIDPSVMPDNPHAEAELTGNPDAGADVNTGLPSEHDTNDRTNADAPGDVTPGDASPGDVTPTSTIGFVQSEPVRDQPVRMDPIRMDPVRMDMMPPSPSTPDPSNPVPAAPETPQPPTPGPVQPEIPDLPGQPTTPSPEIQEPTQPGREHEINAGGRTDITYGTVGFTTYSASFSGTPVTGNFISPDGEASPGEGPGAPEPGEAVPGNQYDGMSAGIDDEGMENEPDTGRSARPYDVNAKDADTYQPGERPQEMAQAQSQPRELMDESSVKADDMLSDGDRSDQKSTDGLDRHYNDPQAARDMAT